MALVIYSNIGHLKAQNTLLSTVRTLDTQLRRISSGLRVTSASDDAAGLAITERMERQTRGISKAIQNAQDGISLAQTASGAYQETSTLLQRMRELTVQGLSEQLNQSDRIALQDEIEQIKDELDHIGNLEFNGRKLFGEDFNLQLSDSLNVNGTMQLSTKPLSSNHLGHHVMHSAESPVNASAAFGDDTLQIITASGAVVNIRGTSKSDDLVSFYQPDGSAIAKAAAINDQSALHGVTALVGPTVAVGIQVQETTLDTDNFIRINGVEITGFKVEESDVDGTLLKAINAEYEETGVLASIDGQGRLTLTAKDGRNIFVETFGDSYLAGLKSGSTGGSITLTSAETFTLKFLDQATNEALGKIVPTIQVQQTYLIADGSRAISPAGGMYTAGLSGISSDLNNDFNLAGIGIGSVNTIRPNEGQDLNLRSTGQLLMFDSNGLTYGDPRFIELKDTIAGGETTTIELNVLALGDTDFTEFYGRGIITSLGNSMEAPDSGVTNEDLLLQYSLDDGVTWQTHSTLVDAHKIRGQYPPAVLPAVDPNGDTEEERLEQARILKSVTFSQNYKLRIAQLNYSPPFGSINSFDHYGIVYGAIKTTPLSEGIEAVIGKNYEHSVGSVNLLDDQGRRSALYVIDQALEEVNEAQVALGAVQNRLQATIHDLEATRASTMQAQSRIRDADFALEVAELSRAQIIQGANTEVLSMLSQQPAMVLQLLRS